MKSNGNKPNNNKGGKPNSGTKPNNRKDKTFDRDGNPKDIQVQAKYEDCHSNDIAWWNRVDYLYSNATKLGFSLNRGETVQLADTNYSIPAVMTYDFIPTIGQAKDIRDFVNKYLNKLFTQLESKTSGTTKQFQCGELGLTYCALSSLSALFAMTQRAIACVNVHSSLNYYWPQALVQACGINVRNFQTEVVENVPNYVVRYNELVDTFNTLYVPNFITSFNRHFSLAYNVYTEDNTDLTEVFLFRPKYVYRWNDVESTCEPVEVPLDGNTTIDDWLDLIEDILLKFSTSDIFKTINSYMVRAMPQNTFVRLDYIDEQRKPSVWVDPVLNIQVHNMTIIPDVLVESFQISVDALKNSLVCRPRTPSITNAIDDIYAAYDKLRIMDLPIGWTDAAAIMECTRLTPAVKKVEDEENMWHWDIYPGTELVIGANMWNYTYDANSGKFNDSTELSKYTFEQYMDDQSLSQNVVARNMRFQFKYRPIGYVIRLASGTYDADLRILGVDHNLQIFRKVTFEDLFRLHKAAHASVWAMDYIPDVTLPK